MAAVVASWDDGGEARRAAESEPAECAEDAVVAPWDADLPLSADAPLFERVLAAAARSAGPRACGGVQAVAPMVRYSKLPFRLLCRRYGADLCYTPMILADGFVRSERARTVELSTCALDRPLVVQFAARDAVTFGRAAQLVVGAADAVDLNCGCPQAWARREGVGGRLSAEPELVADMVRCAREMTGGRVAVSVKIRVQQPDLRRTVELVRRAEHMGVAWVAVHGRTVHERHQPVHHDAIREVKLSARVPVLANGDVFAPADAERTLVLTGADGVMSARGVLANPALFAGLGAPPAECVRDYLQLAQRWPGTPFALRHKHLGFMLAAAGAPRHERAAFACLRSMAAVVAFFQERGLWHAQHTGATAEV